MSRYHEHIHYAVCEWDTIGPRTRVEALFDSVPWLANNCGNSAVDEVIMCVASARPT
jgi:hypothetical protein